MTEAGAGRYSEFVAPDQLQNVEKWLLFSFIITVIGSLTNKISIGIFVLRIKKDRKRKVAVWTILSLMALASIVGLSVLFSFCHPLQAWWNPTISGFCNMISALETAFYITISFGIMTDIFLTISPVVILWNIKITLSRKLGICLLMSLGLIATIANALRMIYIPTFDRKGDFNRKNL